MPTDADLYREALRLDFVAFVHRVFRELNPTTPFDYNWHIEVTAAALEDCRLGRCRRLIINVPPRSLKTLIASVAFPAWLLGHNPSAKIITVSYGADLAEKNARDCRQIMNSQFFKELFPECRLADRQAVHEFETTAGGLRYSTSVGGPLTGRGADYIILDDTLKPDQALSDRERINVNTWFSNTVRSRLDDQRHGVIINIMQRLHLDDLVGHVLPLDQWRVVRLPAIAEEPETHVVDTPHGRRTFRRVPGEVLHPTRQPLEVLSELKASMSDYDFSGQYQQRPVPLGGGMIKQHWFLRFDRLNPPSFDRIVQSWDTASTPGTLGDFSVCTTWAIARDRYYLLDVFRERLGYPELKQAVVEQARLFRPDSVLIEDKSSGTALIQDLRAAGVRNVEAYKPKGDKIIRMHAQTATIKSGFVFVPEEAHWVDEYLNEMTSFHYGKHDDQVDSTSQFLDWAKVIEPAFLTYMRREVERLTSSSSLRPITRLKRPNDSITTVYLMNATSITLGADGIIGVSGEDASALMRSGWTIVED
jgi:predicted phage terminase large subunit-like protein